MNCNRYNRGKNLLVLLVVLVLLVGCGPKKLEDYSKKPSEEPLPTGALTETTEQTETEGQDALISVLNGDLRIPDYTTLSYAWSDSLSVGELEEQLSILANGYTTYSVAEEQSLLKDGDTVLVDAKFYDAADQSLLAEVSDYYLTLDTGCAFGEESVAALVGQDSAQQPTVTVEAHFPENAWVTEASGKDVKLEIHVKKVMTASVPEIDDAWIDAHFEQYQTVSQYKEAIQKAYEEQAEAEARELAGAYVVNSLCSGLEWNNLSNRGDGFLSDRERDAYYALLGVAEVASIAISEEEFQTRLEAHRAEDTSHQGLTDEDYLKLLGKDYVTENMLVEKTLEYCIELAVSNGRQ